MIFRTPNKTCVSRDVCVCVSGKERGGDGTSRRRRATPPETQTQASRRVASIAADLLCHRSSTTFVASSLFLASRPLSTQRGYGGFVRGTKSTTILQSTVFLRSSTGAKRRSGACHGTVGPGRDRVNALPILPTTIPTSNEHGVIQTKLTPRLMSRSFE